MKKIAFLAGLMCVTLFVAAQSTSTSRIVLKTAGQPNKEVNFFLSSEFSDAFDNGYDAAAANPGGIYVLVNEDRFTTWVSNAYTPNLALGFVAAASGSHTLSFENFTGAEYKIYDRIADQTIEVNASTPDYVFTADAGAHNNRFVINYSVDNLSVCFIDNVLEISSNPYDADIVVKDADGNQVTGSPFAVAPTPQNISLASLPAGRYTVEFGDGARKFVVIVK